MKIITNYPNAYGPDYDHPEQGASQNNHSNEVYLLELERLASKKNFSYLDLGCAGGQSVIDLFIKGNISCGIDGSNLDKMIKQSKSRSKPEPRYIGDLNTYNEDVHDNWLKYKDICLFKADITKPFQLFNEKDEIQKFDLITAWDVLEHLLPESVDDFLENLRIHLSENGHFICLINLVENYHHRCTKPKGWWIEKFEKFNFEDVGFNFNSSPRKKDNPTCENDLAFIFKHKKYEN